jgi:hypothetical protein
MTKIKPPADRDELLALIREVAIKAKLPKGARAGRTVKLPAYVIMKAHDVISRELGDWAAHIPENLRKLAPAMAEPKGEA